MPGLIPRLLVYSRRLFSLRDDADEELTITEIKASVDFRGGNLWALVLAIVVASVGNSGLEIMSYSAGYQQVIGVGSTDMQDVQSIFTNFGDNVTTIAAPGEALVTLYPGGRYAAGWGTSFSTPFVSATVSMMARIHSALNWERAEAGIVITTQDDHRPRERLGLRLHLAQRRACLIDRHGKTRVHGRGATRAEERNGNDQLPE